MWALRSTTSDAWVDVVLSDFDAFLVDHAACERKASANAISLVTHYPDRRDLVRILIELAREELAHFQAVVAVLDERGLSLGPDRKDPYLRALRAEVRSGPDPYFLDRLLIAGIAEARGEERFDRIARALPSGPLADFYDELARSEARHRDVFVELAGRYFARDVVEARLDALLDCEARIVEALPPVAALH